MTLNKQIKISVEGVLNEKIIETQSVSGGCINDAKIIVTEKNNRFFLKTNSNQLPDFFYKEANGLNEIKKSKTIRVPAVINVTNNYILLEYIASSSKSKRFWEDFGADSFNPEDFFASEAALNFVMMGYNLMSLFRQAILQGKTQHQLKTFRYRVFAIGSYITKNGNEEY